MAGNTPVTGTFAATGTSNNYIPFVSDRATNFGGFNVTITGTFVGTARLERSTDNGSNFAPLTVQTSGGVVTLYQFTAPGTETVQEMVPNCVYRLNCTAYTSGTINYTIGQ